MEYEAIEIKNDGAVAWLTLNRPHNLNALSAQMVADSFLKKAYSEGATTAATPASNTPNPPVVIPPPASGERPVLKKPNPSQLVGSQATRFL